MTYAETIEYLFACAPMYQQVGAGAYKPGLHTTELLDAYLGYPHRRFKTIHVGGTNGKGSCAHTLAAILQADSHYERVGLYTSPHLMDFRERFRVNGEPMSEAYVVDFVAKHRAFFEPLMPSFFEITTVMGLAYFADMNVDIAVVEVGLGGRLDCTNVIQPLVSVITNVSLDHTQLLGRELSQIATEKAGIIKPQTPVVVGEHSMADVVFERVAEVQNAPLLWAEDQKEVCGVSYDAEREVLVYDTATYGSFEGQLTGLYQQKNAETVLAVVNALRRLGQPIALEAVRKGFAQVCDLTQLRGRWQTLRQRPRVVCDTGHNVAGLTCTMQQLTETAQGYEHLHIVFGMVDDKDVLGALPLLPPMANYYWCEATTKRAVKSKTIQQLALLYGLHGDAYHSVAKAYEAALNIADVNDLIFVGGSSYVVADLLVFLS